ncbi:MAG: hypothetical protein A2096_02855 [Spirochaetes bacterium GWF1_41_5]|nr:MAG: hypothetical protein A2096_02855 [Spirochaetes bacterium GWF1_41_5]HBE02634.1 hypothetical protein [Spirochaetia bacterium]
MKKLLSLVLSAAIIFMACAPSNSGYLAVSSVCKNLEAAYKFFKFFISEEGANRFAFMKTACRTEFNQQKNSILFRRRQLTVYTYELLESIFIQGFA